MSGGGGGGAPGALRPYVMLAVKVKVAAK